MFKKVSVKTKSNITHVMSVDTYTRWLCLVEALQLINQQAEKSKIDLEKNNSWIKPIALQKYINQRFPAMSHDFKVEESINFS
jgi:hypothetical protein